MIDRREAMDLLDRSGVIVIRWSTEANMSAEYISDNISQFGYEPADFYEGEFTDYYKFVHPEDRERVRKEIHDARATLEKADRGGIGSKESDRDRGYIITYRINCKNGEIRWVEETLMQDYEDGKLTERGFMRDVTSSYALISQMKNAEEKYKFIFNRTEELVFAVDKNDIITLANPYFTKVTGLHAGLSASELLGQLPGTSFFKRIEGIENTEMQLYCKMAKKKLKIAAETLRNGDIIIIAKEIEREDQLEERIRNLEAGDFLSNIHNQNRLERFISDTDATGYRAVMARIIDYKNNVQKHGFDYAKDLEQKVANAISEEFAMYDDNIYRPFEDEFVIFTRSPINNIHIFQVNKALQPEIRLEWGLSKRGKDFKTIMNEARINFREYTEKEGLGKIFGSFKL